MVKTSEDMPVDALIQWSPRAGTMELEPAPGTVENIDIGLLMKRYCSMRPMKPDAAEHYIARVLTHKDAKYKPEPLYKMGYGTCLMAERVKQIFDEFDCPGIEYIPVTAYSVTREYDVWEKGIRGKQIDEPFWVMNCYNFHDVIDKNETVGKWHVHRPYDLTSLPQQFSPDDPPELFNPQRITLTSVPEDAMFGVTGLPMARFVSEALFQRIVTSGLFDPRLSKPFQVYPLIAKERGKGGYRDNLPPEQRRPLRLNGRTLYWGNIHQPLDFPRDGELEL